LSWLLIGNSRSSANTLVTPRLASRSSTVHHHAVVPSHERPLTVIHQRRPHPYNGSASMDEVFGKSRVSAYGEANQPGGAASSARHRVRAAVEAQRAVASSNRSHPHSTTTSAPPGNQRGVHSIQRLS
jgi:hypothetical protein